MEKCCKNQFMCHYCASADIKANRPISQLMHMTKKNLRNFCNCLFVQILVMCNGLQCCCSPLMSAHLKLFELQNSSFHQPHLPALQHAVQKNILNSSRRIIKSLASPCCQDACESSFCFSSAMLKKFLTRASSQPSSAKAGS